MSNDLLNFTTERHKDLSLRLQDVRASIAEAAQDFSGAREKNSPLPELTVVTKFFPASDVAALYDLGVRRVGENRDQEAAAKAELLTRLPGESQDPLRWAFIGQLQSNKAKSVVKYAAEVQSVDRLSLVKALSKAYSSQLARAENDESPFPWTYSQGGLSCLIQVNLQEGGESTAGHAAQGLRGGVLPSEIEKIAEAIENSEGLRCAGLMAVAPLGAEPERAFERLWGIAQKFRENYPQATRLSAGMSGDLKTAIRWGSTEVRVGSQIMGPRPAIR